MDTDITTRQQKVETLILALVEGAERLAKLDGRRQEFRNTASDDGPVFTGVVQSTMTKTLQVGVTLRDMVNDILGLTFQASFQFAEVVKSKAEKKALAEGDVDGLFAEFEKGANAFKNNVVAQIEARIADEKARAYHLKKALQDVEDAKKASDQLALEAAIKDVMQVAAWGTVVNVPALLKALRGMIRLAEVASKEGYDDAAEVLAFLKDKQAKGPGFWFTSRGSLIKKYDGPVRVEIIASEMLRGLVHGEEKPDPEPEPTPDDKPECDGCCGCGTPAE